MRLKPWGNLLQAQRPAAAATTDNGDLKPQDRDEDEEVEDEGRDHSNGHRTIYTRFLMVASFVSGVVISQRGPSILDLADVTTHTQSSLSLQSTLSLFAIGGVGQLVGCLGAALLLGRLSTCGFLFWAIVGLALSTSALPWCSGYEILATVYCLSLMCVGSIETGSYADVAKQWGSEGRSRVQLLQLWFVAGGVISPTITQFLLAPRNHHHPYIPFDNVTESRYHAETASQLNIADKPSSAWNITTVPTSEWNRTNESTSVWDMTDEPKSVWNVTDKLTSVWNLTTASSSVLKMTYTPSSTQTGWNESLTINNDTTEDSKVHIAYAISGVLALLLSIPFLVMFFLKRRNRNQNQDHHLDPLQRRRSRKRETDPMRKPETHSISRSVGFLAALFVFLVCAVEESLQQILFTFLVLQAHWVEQAAAWVTSWFWTGMLLVRLADFFLPDQIRDEAILALSLFALPCMLIGLHISVVSCNVNGVWACVFFAGMSVSLLFPLFFTWMNNNLAHGASSSSMSGIIVLSSLAAGIVNPLVAGYFMNRVSYLAFTLMLTLEAVLALMLFLALYRLSRKRAAQWGDAEAARKSINVVPDKVEEAAAESLDSDIQELNS